MKAAVFFDIDGTWYRWQLFDEWIKKCVELGIMPKVVLSLTEDQRVRYETRQGSFDEWMNAQVAAYQGDGRLAGIRVTDASYAAERVIREKGKRIHVFPRELSQAAVIAEYQRVIISGSPLEVVEAFAKHHDIDHYFGTMHPKKEGFFTGDAPEVWSSKKGQAVEKIALKLGLDLRQSVAIGDSVSDFAMLDLVGYPICFNPCKDLLTIAKMRGWPVVFEKKDVVMLLQRTSESNDFRSCTLDAVLSADLKQHFKSDLFI